MPVFVWFAIYLWLHWPFLPGVFIAILGFWAAAMTFWEKPPKLVKAGATFVFFVLMCLEIWMLGIDRDIRDAAELQSRKTSQAESVKLDLLIVQSTTANNRLDTIDQEIVAAKGNPQLIARLLTQRDQAKAQIKSANNQLLIELVQTVIKQINDRTFAFEGQRASINDQSEPGGGPGRSGRAQVAKSRTNDLTNKYQTDLGSILITADYLRQQMLQGQIETPEDEREAVMFRAALQGNYEPFDSAEAVSTEVVKYLGRLTARLATQSH
jgi:hypothetical protein